VCLKHNKERLYISHIVKSKTHLSILNIDIFITFLSKKLKVSLLGSLPTIMYGMSMGRVGHS